MDRYELRALLLDENEPEDRDERLIIMAIDALEEGASHHKQWRIEQILEALGVNIDELYELQHGIDKRNWPERGIAP